MAKEDYNHDVVRGVSGEVKSLSKLTCMGLIFLKP
jgi:hypothetical protein